MPPSAPSVVRIHRRLVTPRMLSSNTHPTTHSSTHSHLLPSTFSTLPISHFILFPTVVTGHFHLALPSRIAICHAVIGSCYHWYQFVPNLSLFQLFLPSQTFSTTSNAFPHAPLQRSFVIALEQRILVTVRIDVAYPPYHHTRDCHTIPTLNTFPHTAHPLLVSA